MAKYILAIDQGTTSTRSVVFDDSLNPIAKAQQEFAQHFPNDGYVEHSPEDIWESVLATARNALVKANKTAAQITAIGITNQRETTVLWNRKTGKPIYNAIVWQDRRTIEKCIRMKADGLEEKVRSKTGLLLDPYFSATKIAWILDHVAGAREAANAGMLAFGTIDSFLLWRLTGGRVHATDATNASRTLLYNIHEGCWDNALLEMFNIPPSVLPDVKDCAADFGVCAVEHFGAPIPILGMAGDQQAAIIGQGCFKEGMLKITYGTGCFALFNTGAQPVVSKNRLLTTLAYQFNGQPTYALEGSIFMAGATVQWLRDGLKIIDRADDADGLAEKADPAQHVYLVPAFVGLGAPWWDAAARGALFGLTRNSGSPELARAALESVGYQTRDLLEAMQADWQISHTPIIRVDGGMTASTFTMQFLADILNMQIDRPANLETTVRGAAYLAGKQAGCMPDLAEFATRWQCDKSFIPSMEAKTRNQKWQGWQDAVRRIVSPHP